MPEGIVANLLNPENKDTLVAILTYHVPPGKVMAADVTTSKPKTVYGETVDVKVGSDGVMVDGAKVVKTDIPAGSRVTGTRVGGSCVGHWLLACASLQKW